MIIVIVLLLCVVFATGVGIALYLMAKTSGPSLADRLAALDESRGVEQSQNALTRFVGEQQQRILISRFLEAGWDTMTPVMFITRSVIGGVAGFVLAAIFQFFVHLNVFVSLFCAFICTFGGFYYQTAMLDNAIKRRKVAIQRSLPDMLDIIASTVQAGIALNGAIAIAAEGLENELAMELRKALQDIRLGRSRSDALMAMGSRVKEPTLNSTITAIVQADRLGGDIANVLEELALDARDNRLMRAEEIANALPNKLVFPMALFMLPSLFVVIFGAVAAHLLYPDVH